MGIIKWQLHGTSWSHVAGKKSYSQQKNFCPKLELQNLPQLYLCISILT